VQRKYRDQDWTQDVEEFAEPLVLHDAAFDKAEGSKPALKARKVFHDYYRPRVERALEDREREDYERVLAELRAHFSKSSLRLPPPECAPSPPPEPAPRPQPVAAGEKADDIKPVAGESVNLRELDGLVGLEDMDEGGDRKGRGGAAVAPRRNTSAGIKRFEVASQAEADQSVQAMHAASLHADSIGQPELAEILRVAAQGVRDRQVMIELLIDVSRHVKAIADEAKKGNSKNKSTGGGGLGSRKERKDFFKKGLLPLLWTGGLFPEVGEPEFLHLLSAVGGERPEAAVKKNCQNLVASIRKSFAAAIRNEFTARFAPQNMTFPIKAKKGKVIANALVLFRFLSHVLHLYLGGGQVPG
jgi:hypothetical protein